MINMNNTRTKNSARNMSFTLLSQTVILILKFVSQTVFIKILGSQYLGLNGLFTNILTMLSFTELGIGNAIIFSMYKPIAEEDNNKIIALMRFYKKSYTIIGIVVLVIGMLLVPFLKYIVNDVPDVKENILFVYFLFLLNTSISYFFTYKKSIIIANQKDFIVNLNNLLFNILKLIFQCLILLLTKNYILYLLIQLSMTFFENSTISKKANKMYPYIISNELEKLSKKETKKIFANVKSLTLYKFGSVILNGTDNILISSMFGTAIVGVLSNYTLIVSSINGIVSNVLSSITSSIGNLNAIGDKKRKEEVFSMIFFLTFWIYGYLSIALMLLLSVFIKVWLGDSYLLNNITIFAIVLGFYVDGMRFVGYTYRTTLGLFTKGKYTPLIAAIINIILSIILGRNFGITGILLATSISRLCTTVWFDPYLVYKNEFKKSPLSFYCKYIKYIIVVFLVGFINYYILSYVNIKGILGFISEGFICTIITNLIFILIFFNTKEFNELYKKTKNLILIKKAS